MGIRKKSRKNRSRRAVSPVIATVILVAIAITIAVAVAYWMGSIAGTFTKFEQVEIQSAVCEAGTGAWNITMKMKNTGDATATLNGVFVSDLEATTYGAAGPTAGQVTTDMSAAETINSGANATIRIWISDTYKDLTSGTVVNIKIHSAGGMDYIKMIELV